MALTLDELAILHDQGERQRFAYKGDALLVLASVLLPSPARRDCARGHFVIRKAALFPRQRAMTPTIAMSHEP